MDRRIGLLALLLVLPLTPLTLSAPPYTVPPGSFLVYNETVYLYSQGKVLVDKIVIIQQVVEAYSNGTILVNSTVVSLTDNSTVSSALSLQNASQFGPFYHVDPELLGKPIKDGNTTLAYNGTEDGLYEYVGKSELGLNGQVEESVLILYFNSSGVVVKGVDYDVANGALLSKSVIALWVSNLFANATLPRLNVEHSSAISISFNSRVAKAEIEKKIMEGILIFGFFSTLGILMLRNRGS